MNFWVVVFYVDSDDDFKLIGYDSKMRLPIFSTRKEAREALKKMKKEKWISNEGLKLKVEKVTLNFNY